MKKITFLYMCKKFTIVTTKFNQNGGKDWNIKSILTEMIELGCLPLLMINKSRHSKEAVSTTLTEAGVLGLLPLLMLNRGELHKRDYLTEMGTPDAYRNS